MVGILRIRGDVEALDRRVFRNDVIVVEADEDQRLHAEKIGELHADVGDRAARPGLARDIGREEREVLVLVIAHADVQPVYVIPLEAVAQIVAEPFLRTCQPVDFIGAVLGDEAILHHIMLRQEAHLVLV